MADDVWTPAAGVESGRAPLSVEQILAWADAHHAAHGVWPSVGPGARASAVLAALGESWKAINHALALGLRGLPGGSSLAELLAQHRGAPVPGTGPRSLADRIWAWEQQQFLVNGSKRRGSKTRSCPRLRVAQIVAWAEAEKTATGALPTAHNGRIRAAPFDITWRAVDKALRLGLRGLPGGCSLARLLNRHREPRPRLTDEQIVAWAQAHHAAHGQWPTARAGAVDEAPGENWSALDRALRLGRRGLTGGSSLSALLISHVGPDASNRPALTLEQIRAWAQAHEAATGKWPTVNSGPVRASPYATTWKAVGMALVKGGRGLPRGFSLARLRPGADEPRPQLTPDLILAWADAHHAAKGSWPIQTSGRILAAPRESWAMIDRYLRNGGRGLHGGSCLSRLLAERRRKQSRFFPPDLTIEQILTWADAYHAAHGVWPRYASGPVDSAPGETWNTIDGILWTGGRGLPGGSTLFRLLDQHRGPQIPVRSPPGQGTSRSRRFSRLRGPYSTLTLDQILSWAKAHRAATGAWPRASSGPVIGAPGEKWASIDDALCLGRRGLPGGLTLLQHIARTLDPTVRVRRPNLTVDQILTWADAYFAAHGRWPSATCTAISGATDEIWKDIDTALRLGRRGLPSGLTLRKLFLQYRRGAKAPAPRPEKDRT